MNTADEIVRLERKFSALSAEMQCSRSGNQCSMTQSIAVQALAPSVQSLTRWFSKESDGYVYFSLLSRMNCYIYCTVSTLRMH